MHFPKYVEFADGNFVIFHQVHQHSVIAANVGLEPVSAGMMCAVRRPSGKFFGVSTSLNLEANNNLSLDSKPLYSGMYYRDPITASDPRILDALGVSEYKLAPLVEIDEMFYPMAEGADQGRVIHFFEP